MYFIICVAHNIKNMKQQSFLKILSYLNMKKLKKQILGQCVNPASSISISNAF